MKGLFIRYSGPVFEGEAGRKYAGVVKKIVDACKAGLDEVSDGGVCDKPCSPCLDALLKHS